MTTRAQLAALLEDRLDRLIDLWQELGAYGPTFGSVNPPEFARARYLHPLARVLVGGLRGAADHTAVYLDERLRFETEPTQRRDLFSVEFPAVAKLLADVVEPAYAEKALWEYHAPLIEPIEPTSRVLFIGDCLFVDTRAFLTQLARNAGAPIDVRQVFFSAHQAIDSVNHAIIDAVTSYKPDLIGISLFSFEGVPLYRAAWKDASVPFVGKRAFRMIEPLTDLMQQAITDIRTVSEATIVVHAPVGVPLVGVPFDKLRQRMPMLGPHSAAQHQLLGKLGASIQELVAGTVNTITLDERALVTVQHAAAPVFDPSDVPPGCFHTTRLGTIVAREYNTLISEHTLLRSMKAVLVDFDNTLWSGVMAEGGVAHHVERQKLLLELKNAGILLIALSKNDMSSIRWDEMVLKEDDFVSLKINWKPKPDNVTAVIDELNLAPNAFLLLDDNPVERALISEQVVGVRAVDPNDPATWRAFRHWFAFPSTRQTEESKTRTAMYREAAQRRTAMSQSHDYAAMMQSLKLKCTVRPAIADDMPRLIELMQRTNQFNTTTRRRSTAEIEQLLADPGFGVYVASVKDRIGDLGIIAVAVFDRPAQTFDSVIMSCRAMGFAVEMALLRRVLDAEQLGAVAGLFIATERNGPAADLFARAGFQQGDGQDGGATWLLPADAAGPQVPAWMFV
jgi:FkbH-like protein